MILHSLIVNTTPGLSPSLYSSRGKARLQSGHYSGRGERLGTFPGRFPATCGCWRACSRTRSAFSRYYRAYRTCGRRVCFWRSPACRRRCCGSSPVGFIRPSPPFCYRYRCRSRLPESIIWALWVDGTGTSLRGGRSPTLWGSICRSPPYRDCAGSPGLMSVRRFSPLGW